MKFIRTNYIHYVFFLKKNILKIRLEANQAQVLNCKVQLLLREYQLHAHFCILNIYSKRHRLVLSSEEVCLISKNCSIIVGQVENAGVNKKSLGRIESKY